MFKSYFFISNTNTNFWNKKIFERTWKKFLFRCILKQNVSDTFFFFNKNFSYIKSIFPQLGIIPLEKLWLALIEQNTKTMKLGCASVEFGHSLPKGFSLNKIFPSFPLGYIQLQNKSCVKKVSLFCIPKSETKVYLLLQAKKGK